jgi:glyoxylase-like metal-dependent hydrolase (beta-lactamase superfamily II)/mono/diheme cytochrome c family protein
MFSETQVSDEQIMHVFAYLTSLPEPETPARNEAELAADAHPGQVLVAEKRCIACHSPTGPIGPFNQRAEEPTAEAVINQLRTPRNRMPSFSEQQVSDEEAAIIAEFLLTEYSPELQEAPTPLEKVIAGVGGQEALQGLNSLVIESNGTRWIFDEQFSPGSPAGEVGAFTSVISYSIGTGSLKIVYTRQGGAGARQVTEVIAGELGYIDGQDAGFGPPGVKAMTSDRWASILKQQRLLNPHMLVQEIVANPDMVSEADEQLLDGSVHHLLIVQDEVAPITLYVNAATGHISKLATMENDHLRRDVPLEAFYYGWQQVGNLMFPNELYIALDGEIVLQELRTAVEVNPELDPAIFEIPAEASPVFDEALAMRGELSHQYNQSFAAAGFIKDGAQTEINVEEVAPGIFLLGGVANNSLVVEQDNGIVVIDAPLHQYRSEAVIEWIKSQFPDKPITHVVSTHHHTDHSAGLRTYVAEGATVVLHEAAAPFFEAIFQASSTISPDALANNPVEATIEAVPGAGSVTIHDGTHPVEVYPMANEHAEDMVIIYVGNPGVVYVSDLYSPNPAATEAGAGGQLLHDTITMLGLEVAAIAGGHGTTITWEDFENLVGAE